MPSLSQFTCSAPCAYALVRLVVLDIGNVAISKVLVKSDYPGVIDVTIAKFQQGENKVCLILLLLTTLGKFIR